MTLRMSDFQSQPALMKLAGRNANQRQTGRLPQESLASSLGPVLDFSAGGMRVCVRRVPKGTIDIELIGLGGRATVKAEVIWTRRVGLFKRMVGLRFLNVDPATQATLNRMSSENRSRRLLASHRQAA